MKEKLAVDAKVTESPWMAAFGKLRHLRKESAKINKAGMVIRFPKGCWSPIANH